MQANIEKKCTRGSFSILWCIDSSVKPSRFKIKWSSVFRTYKYKKKSPEKGGVTRFSISATFSGEKSATSINRNF